MIYPFLAAFRPAILSLTGIVASLVPAATGSAAGQIPPAGALKWGDDGPLHKWICYPYEIESQYPYRHDLPGLDEFPKILKFSGLSESDREIVISQLRTLSRCAFVESQHPDYETGFKKWQAWWDNYGSRLVVSLRKEGRTYPESWKLVDTSNAHKCPSYPLVLPTSWSFELRFRSGDYSSVVKEEISMEVTPTHATLSRRYQAGATAGWITDDMLVGGGKKDPPWTIEEWKGLKVPEAQRFLAALIYAIDNPWIYVDDRLSNDDGGPFGGSIAGRPEEWSNYAADVSWTGILDEKGNTLINDDVWSWEPNFSRMNDKSMLDFPIGVVFRVIRDVFPDPVWNRWYMKRSRWRKVASSPAFHE